MSYPRAVLLLLAVVALPTLLTFSLLHAHPRVNVATDTTEFSEGPSQKNDIRAFFSFHTPSTLFPPSAVISLTDDNSTFFLARPADFGPKLAPNGLSGQLWIGSGFGDGTGRGSADTGAEGELGCSDVPGWDEFSKIYRSRDTVIESTDVLHKITEANVKDKRSTEGAGGGVSGSEVLSVDKGSDSRPSEDDGTDDHLHHPLPSSPVSKPSKPGEPAEHEQARSGLAATHGDIQSLQESAEITGKVVLLSRGGCGFLEKVKWAQRRGATALIVGDHTRGGALVTMYARGDTSNVSIPSLFTSHTTAHLLSSLIPVESITGEIEQNHKDALGSRVTKDETIFARPESDDDRPTFTAATSARSTSTPSTKSGRILAAANPHSFQQTPKKSWIKSLFSRTPPPDVLEDRTRPPSSGRLDWWSPKWTDTSPSKPDTKVASKKQKDKIKSVNNAGQWSGSSSNSGDDFVIGVQDWRDPDLVATSASPSKVTASTLVALSTSSISSKSGKDGDLDKSSGNPFSGGSITPGSGQYHNLDQQGGLHSLNRPVVDYPDSRKQIVPSHATKSKDLKFNAKDHHRKPDEEHDGLWVTLTPTSMSTSPFFDTLLVLVVSPLVTLTVVYALLLLRSRIRRRRWRAPKSVVDRLPIRTYHTMSSCSSTTSSTHFTSPQNSSPTSPLLQSSPRSRPRSATTSGIGEAVSDSLERATIGYEKEKARPKKYHGKQIECVVCLEEYVDGKSKVMSLPCGHEFHAECITPWLTTRRRTCPICKGDVVRSLTGPYPVPANPTSRTRPESSHSGDVQTQAAETANDSPTAAIPIPCNNDLERGEDMAATLVNDQPEASAPRGGWRSLANMSLSAFSGEVAWRESQREDRTR